MKFHYGGLTADLNGTRSLINQIKEIQKLFPQEVDSVVLEVALVDVETFAKRETDIPVDSGRLRASIHTKFAKRPSPEVARSKSRLQKKIARSENGLPDSQLSFSYHVPAVVGDDGEIIEKAKTYDGSLETPLDLNSVLVGTNVEYAKKINRRGGGGPNSRSQLPLGTGQGFFDKAVKNGERQLINQMRNLVNRMDRIAKKAKEKSGGGAD